MKKALIIISAILFTSCAAQSAQKTSENKNALPVNNSNITSAHSANTSAPKENSPTMTGNARAIDTTEFDAKILAAEKDFKAKPKDKLIQIALAGAYSERAFALTEAAQYRAALGDFRKSLKLNPADADALKMHDQIINIFKSLNREPPKEGEEPAPMPYKKEN